MWKNIKKENNMRNGLIDWIAKLKGYGRVREAEMKNCSKCEVSNGIAEREH